jgi:small-conductance mechanosensitive channel
MADFLPGNMDFVGSLVQNIPLEINRYTIFWSFLTIIGSYIVNKAIKYFIGRFEGKKIDLIPGKGERFVKVNKTELVQIGIFVGYIIYGIAFVIVLSIFGVNPTILATSLGVVGIAIGFAGKDIISNLLSGIFLLFERAYGLGDVVKIANTYGIVRSVKLRSTRIETFDGNIVTIPNSKIASSEVVNMTSGSSRMLSSVEVKVSYDENIENVKDLMEKTAKKIDGVYLDENNPARFEVQEIGKRYLGLKIIMYFLLRAKKEPWIKSEVQEKVSRALAKKGISFHKLAGRS